MSNKVLISHTIIPQHLYVYRDADRLMEFLLKDMGRPGYVLVARQMGKTNLLLNAKRNLIGLDDACVYIDFSNTFRNARECFRYIIDLAIETNYEKLYFLSDIIKESRKEQDDKRLIGQDMADHIEHSFELRKILEVVKGKLVIIIDEVDAITTVPFSDTIFKQIRSIYFSRTNFPSLNKLTYILSGVGEPSSLIKDPKISPFNIGQEIFLGDFTYSEYQAFLQQSKLLLSADVSDRIYFWTNGNPRITYEVCAAIEDIIISGISIDVDAVDSVIAKMYLSTFDRVPLDNIRSLIQADYELLESVKNLKSGKHLLITNAQRRKLYLAGIVGADFDSDRITIKNRVIEKALSNEWLEEVSTDENFMQVVSDAFATGNYDEVISLIEKDLDKYKDSSEFVVLQNLVIASHYKKSNFDSIVEHFKRNGIGLENKHISKLEIAKLDALYLYALSLYHTGAYEDSAAIFQKIALFRRKAAVYFNSLLGLANILSQGISLSDEYRESSIVDVYNKIADELDESEASISYEDKQRFKTIVYYNLGVYYREHNEKSVAFSNFRDALNVAADLHRAVILYNMAFVAADEVECSSLFLKAINSIVVCRLKPQAHSIDIPTLISYSVILDLINRSIKEHRAAVLKLISYIYAEEMASPVSFSQELYARIGKEQSLARDKIILLSFDEFADFLSIEQLKYGYNIFKQSTLLPLSSGKAVIKAFIKFDFVEELDSLDALYILFAVKNLMIVDVPFVESCMNFLEKRYFSKSGISASEIVLKDFFEMLLMAKSSRLSDVFGKAKDILTNLKNFDVKNMQVTIVSQSAIQDIRNEAIRNYNNLVGIYGVKEVYRGKGSGIMPDRNRVVTAIYPSGKEVKDKYKRFEKDLLRGKCRIADK